VADTHDITVLNTLIATTLDSVRGFRDAAEDASGTNAEFFRSMADERTEVVTRLQEQVRALGGNPEDDSSTMGAVHRGFMNLKEAVMGSDEKAVIEEVERGEDYLKNKYNTALNDDGLGAVARSAIESAYASVRKGHDRASALKHATTGH
jgi:uncharacterized protein (TIGR02284 family)